MQTINKYDPVGPATKRLLTILLMKHFLLFLLIFLPGTLFSQLKINEIMTNNVSAVWDGSYNFSMWVEIYNPTNSQVNQSLYYFTDNLNEPRKWQPPGKFIAANGYNVLWFERPDRSGHANFRLKPEGGFLFLLSATGAIIDYVVYPPQLRNISYGRKTDGGNEWVFFEEFSNGSSNNGKRFATERCENPQFTVMGGLYPTGVNVRFVAPLPGDTIFYTLSSEEPTRSNSIRYTPGSTISVTSTTMIRAKSFGAGRLSSDVVTATYLVGQRDFKLPVVSIVTPQAFMTDNTVGIYVRGTNGIPGNGTDQPANWNQDWDRPANFELIDTDNVTRLNQELDITIAGGWSRTMFPQKSLHIKPKKKFGENKLNYDIFQAVKPGNQYKDIMFRNSGNDFHHSMMRDGFMQSLVITRLNVDALAYEPAVCFINGVYFGIQNLRERSNSDMIYSNYGYGEEEITILDPATIPNNPEYLNMMNYILNNDITNPTVYKNLTDMMDVDNYISYMMTQIYVGNYDWPHNNIKMWKKKQGGKWRWILYDLDFGFNLYDTNLHNFNALTYALGEASSKSTQPWATALFKRLILNETFRNKFIDLFSIHLSSTFEPTRVNQVMDSIAARISTEIIYHKNRWSGSNRTLSNDLSIMKSFSNNRSNNMFNYLGNRFFSGAGTNTIELRSNIPTATYTFNGEHIQDASINLRSFSGRNVQITANEIQGYNFKHWELIGATSNVSLIPWDSEWRYWDNNGMPATNWFNIAYSDASWKTGIAPLGYGPLGHTTTIGFGGVSSNKYPTAYFRKTINLQDVSQLENVKLRIFVDDGAAVYVNGTEVGRFNLAAGPLTFNTFTITYNNGEYADFNVPVSLLRNGTNLIAVEVHQVNANSSDLIFNLEMTAEQPIANGQVQTNPTITTTLSANKSYKAIYEENNVENPVENATVVINEVVASNNAISDEWGEKDDYIEIYNFGDKTVNIAGWYFSDRINNQRMWQIPTTDSLKTAIPPKGFLVIWCDDQTHQGVLHVNFKLSQSGETVVMSAEDKFGTLHLIDSVSYPYMEQNMSYSRFPDGSDNWVVQPPTIGQSNISTLQNDEMPSSPRVYPTRVIDRIFVENADGKQVTITDLSGKLLYNEFHFETRASINMTFFERGVYIISVEGENYKVLKQ